MIRILAAASAAMLLSGCWFVYIPGSVISAVGDTLTGSFGESCIGPHVKVGDRVNMPAGGQGKVSRISGPHSRCSGATPIRAEVTHL